MKTRSRGFTLIEMLVVIAIMAVISAVILFNNNRFGGVVLLQNLAYDMALSIRQAQGFGIAVQRFNTSFGYAYGMHFQVDASGSSSYVLFADGLTPVNNGTYECPQPGTPNCELVQATTIAAGYRVVQLCVKPPDAAERCDATWVDITFRRPEPDAYILSNVTGSSISDDINESAEIHVASPRGDIKVISVQTNGQISVQ